MRAVKTSFILLMLTLAFRGHSQVTTIVYGFVKDSSTMVGIPNHQVLIHSVYDSSAASGMNYSSTVYTGFNGLFIDTVSTPLGQNIKFKLSTQDCLNQWHVDSFFSATPLHVTFFLCDSAFNNCHAGFYAYPDSSNFKKIFFNDLSSANISSWKWYFGDGDSSQVSNPVHFYPAAGSYVVKLVVKDNMTNCYDSHTDTINVGSTINCANSFTYQTNLLNVSFSGSVNTLLPTIYQWDFGDFTYATSQNPSHSYTHAGIYHVCLSTLSVNPQTYDTCISQSCQYITIQAPPSGNIWGQVFADTAKVKGGQVLLYSRKKTDNFYSLIDSVQITVIDSLNLSFYYFNNKPYGQYLTKAMLDPLDPGASHYGPAYFGNTFKWDQTTSFTLNQGGINQPIMLTHVFSPTGSISLSGRVLEGSQKNPGDPVEGVLLYLYDIQGDVYGYAYSDVQGEYHFQGLKPEKYFVYADVINKRIFPAVVWPDEGQSNLSDINIYIGKDKVTSIESAEGLASVYLYPNPCHDVVQMFLASAFYNKGDLMIYNMLGELVLHQGVEIKPGNNEYKINLGDLSRGVYIVKLRTKDKISFSSKLVISR